MKLRANDKFKELPTAVIFDLDNTLYDYNSAHTPAMKAVGESVCDQFGITEKRYRHELSEVRNKIKTKRAVRQLRTTAYYTSIVCVRIFSGKVRRFLL